MPFETGKAIYGDDEWETTEFLVDQIEGIYAEVRNRKTSGYRKSTTDGYRPRRFLSTMQAQAPTKEQKENLEKALEREIRAHAPSWIELYLPWEVTPANNKHVQCRKNIVKLENELGFCNARMDMGGWALDHNGINRVVGAAFIVSKNNKLRLYGMRAANVILTVWFALLMWVLISHA